MDMQLHKSYVEVSSLPDLIKGITGFRAPSSFSLFLLPILHSKPVDGY